MNSTKRYSKMTFDELKAAYLKALLGGEPALLPVIGKWINRAHRLARVGA